MKILILAVISILLVLLIFYETWWTFRLGDRWTEFMDTNEVCQRWGERPLDVPAFKAAVHDEKVRGNMACSLLRNQKDYIGKDPGEIRNSFGFPDGYYVSDYYDAYIIESAETIEQDSWQILFLVNRTGNVSEIVVHRNCCDDRVRKEIRSTPQP